jgi:hypothetical protein
LAVRCLEQRYLSAYLGFALGHAALFLFDWII